MTCYENSESTCSQKHLTPFDMGNCIILGLLLTSIISIFFPPDTAGALISTLVFLLPASIYAKKRNIPLADAFRLKAVSAKTLIFPACLAPLIILIDTLLLVLLNLVTRGRALEVGQAIPGPILPVSLIPALLVTVILVPVIEEMFFRGFLTRGFGQWGTGWSIFVPAILFAIFHHPLSMPGAFLLGIIAASFTIKHNSIIPAVILHACNNLVPTMVNLLGAMSHDWVFGILLLSVILLSVFVSVFFRKNLKELLGNLSSAWNQFRKGPESRQNIFALLKHWSYIVIILLQVTAIVFIYFQATS